MKNYHLTLILSPLLAEQELNDAMQHITSSIQEKGGILGEQNIKGKRSLASPIKKHVEGYLATLEFTVAPEHAEALESAWKQSPPILRFLLMQQHKRTARPETIPAFSQPASRQKQDARDEQTSSAGGAEAAPEKVDLKDIDEKLEEIFKEPS